jgi:hypothetical protein
MASRVRDSGPTVALPITLIRSEGSVRAPWRVIQAMMRHDITMFAFHGANKDYWEF